jgi:hypothetical protein
MENVQLEPCGGCYDTLSQRRHCARQYSHKAGEGVGVRGKADQ